MKSYSALKAQIDKLEKQATAMRQKEIRKVVAELKKTIADYDLTAADLGLSGAAGKSAGRMPGRKRTATTGVAKYRNPQTGDTWTGRGRPPTWIAAVANRDSFLIAADGSGAKRAVKTAAKKSRGSRGKADGRKGAASAASANA